MRGREGRGERVVQPGGPKVQRKWVTKMVRLFRVEQHSSLGWRSLGEEVEYASQEGPVTG